MEKVGKVKRETGYGISARTGTITAFSREASAEGQRDNMRIWKISEGKMLPLCSKRSKRCQPGYKTICASRNNSDLK